MQQLSQASPLSLMGNKASPSSTVRPRPRFDSRPLEMEMENSTGDKAPRKQTAMTKATLKLKSKESPIKKAASTKRRPNSAKKVVTPVSEQEVLAVMVEGAKFSALAKKHADKRQKRILRHSGTLVLKIIVQKTEDDDRVGRRHFTPTGEYPDEEGKNHDHDAQISLLNEKKKTAENIFLGRARDSVWVKLSVTVCEIEVLQIVNEFFMIRSMCLRLKSFIRLSILGWLKEIFTRQKSQFSY